MMIGRHAPTAQQIAIAQGMGIGIEWVGDVDGFLPLSDILTHLDIRGPSRPLPDGFIVGHAGLALTLAGLASPTYQPIIGVWQNGAARGTGGFECQGLALWQLNLMQCCPDGMERIV
jgi:hypothetical protein